MINYDVAVMNYPLFNKTPPTGVKEKLLAPPYYQDTGGNWPASLYIHIPFCGSLCDFCVYNRVLVSKNKALAEAFVESLLNEIHLYAQSPRITGHKLEAIFLGGGTPTALSASQLRRILQTLRQCFDLRDCEITVECNSLNTDRNKLEILKENGVTRISTGVQSFDDSVRRKYHIAKKAEEVERWLDDLKAFCFDDESLDLIYGFPGIEVDAFLQGVHHAIQRGMGHISIYKLAVFAYTKLYGEMEQRPQDRYPDDESCFEMFRLSHRMLLQNGYILQSAQEYGKAGRTMRYWDATYDGFGDNLAMGVSSFGYLNGYCYQNAVNVESYIKNLKSGQLPVDRISSRITVEQLRERAVIMGFRRGFVSKQSFFDAFDAPVEKIFGEPLHNLVRDGFIRDQGDRYALTEKGLYQQGNISASFMISAFRNVSALKKRMCIGNHEMP